MSWFWPFGSAATGPSNAQKEAEAFPREQANFDVEQYRRLLAQMGLPMELANELNPWAAKYFQNRATYGLGSPYDIQTLGNVIMPDRQPVIDARRSRLNQIGTDIDETFSGARDRLNSLGGRIGENQDIIQGNLNDTTLRVANRGDAVSSDVISNIGETYGGARQGVLDTITGLRTGAGGTFDDMLAGTAGLYEGLQGRSSGRFDELGGRTGDAYTGMRSDSEATYTGARQNNEGAYDTASTTLERMNPAGDAAAARRARSFAPQVALTMGRLRAAGIDPNSPEAASLLGRVETARSRATDDAYADETRAYVDRKNDLTLGKEAVNRGLMLSGLNNRQGLTEREENIARTLGLGEMENFQNLGTEQGAIQRGLTRDRLGNDQRLAMDQLGMDTDLMLAGGKDFRNELLRKLGFDSSLDLNWMNETNRNQNDAFAKMWDWTTASNDLDLTGMKTRANLATQQNDEEAWVYDFNTLAPWRMGMNYATTNAGVQDQAAGTVANMGNAAAGQAISTGNLARGFGGDAASNYRQTQQYESPNAAWLLKMLASAGQAAMTGGMGGGQNPWAGGYNPGSTGVGGQNPWAYTYATQQSQRPQQPTYRF